jgi:Rrf2 family iron-sulfur cluster assembly transcriptional regulator
MKVTALEEYGLRCLLQLARHATHPTPITVRDIADGEGLSAAYAEKLLRLLSRAGLAESVRGVHGGYRLSRPPERVMIGDAFRALGGILSPVDPCHRFTGKRDCCVHFGECGLRPIWGAVKVRLEHLLDKIPLSTLLGTERSIWKQFEVVTITALPEPAGAETEKPSVTGETS